MSDKNEKLNSLIQRELGEIINREVEFEEMLLISISRAITTIDSGLSRIFINCLPEDKGKEAIKELYKNKKFLRQELGKKIKLRRVPKLSFYIETNNPED